MRRSVFAVIAVAVLITGSGQPVAGQESQRQDGRGHGHYANVNGMRMYYEVHGKRRGKPPLVLLHGALSAIGTSFGTVLPTLAKGRQVIAIEQQGHGHTADIDRPLRTELMADDTVELLRQIGVTQADFYGYSMGGEIALDIGIRYPGVVRKLVIAAAPFHTRGFHPGVIEGIDELKPEDLHGSPFHEEYLRIAPRPQDFPILVEKVKDQARHILNFTPAQVRAMRAPTLLVFGDSDIVTPEHAVEFFRLRGGGVVGDTVGLPDSELAILPGTTHVSLGSRADLLLPIIPAFLDRPVPATSGR